MEWKRLEGRGNAEVEAWPELGVSASGVALARLDAPVHPSSSLICFNLCTLLLGQANLVSHHHAFCRPTLQPYLLLLDACAMDPKKAAQFRGLILINEM